LDKLSNSLERFAIETLGKIICPLFFRINFQHDNLTSVHMTPEEMPLHQKVLGSIGNSLFRGEEKCSVVIFEDTASNSGDELGRKSESIDNLLEHGTQRK
jgi:hypothetical protein